MAIGGKNTKFKHGTNGALTTLTDFTDKVRDLNLNLDAEQVDSTTFGDTYKDFEQSFKNGSHDCTYKYDDTLWGQLTAIYNNGDIVSFEVSPDGSTSGKPKATGSMFITKLNLPAKVGELLELSLTWQVTGAVVFGSHA